MANWGELTDDVADFFNSATLGNYRAKIGNLVSDELFDIKNPVHRLDFQKAHGFVIDWYGQTVKMNLVEKNNPAGLDAGIHYIQPNVVNKLVGKLINYSDHNNPPPAWQSGITHEKTTRAVIDVEGTPTEVFTYSLMVGGSALDSHTSLDPKTESWGLSLAKFTDDTYYYNSRNQRSATQYKATSYIGEMNESYRVLPRSILTSSTSFAIPADDGNIFLSDNFSTGVNSPSADSSYFLDNADIAYKSADRGTILVEKSKLVGKNKFIAISFRLYEFADVEVELFNGEISIGIYVKGIKTTAHEENKTLLQGDLALGEFTKYPQILLSNEVLKGEIIRGEIISNDFDSEVAAPYTWSSSKELIRFEATGLFDLKSIFIPPNDTDFFYFKHDDSTKRDLVIFAGGLDATEIKRQMYSSCINVMYP